MNDPHLRIGDAERAAAAADLGEHYAQGRLTAEEHDERVGRIWSARTGRDLAPVFADLPSSYAAPPAPASSSGTSRERRPGDRYWNSGLRPFRNGWPAPLLVILAVLGLITVVTHLPVILIGLLVFWFVAHRHGHHRPRRGWRY